MPFKIAMFFVLLGCISSAYSKTHPNKILSKYPILSIKNSKNELKVARYFDTFYRNIKRGKLNKNSIKGIFKFNQKVSTFYPLNSEIKRAYLISNKSRTLSQLHLSCFKAVPQTTDHPIGIDLKKLLDKYCRTRLLQLLTKKKYPSQIRAQYLDNLKLHIPKILKGENINLFSKYLSRISKKSDLYKLMSNIVNEAYLSKDIIPSSKVLAYINISEPLSKMIQKKGILNTNTKSIFTKEFRKISKQFSAIVRTNNKGAKEKIDELIVFYKKNNEFIDHDIALKHFTSAGKELLYVDQKKSQEIFNYLLTISKQTKTNDGYFYILWNKIFHGHYSDAEDLIEKHNLLKRFNSLDTKLKFWVAYIIEQNGGQDHATTLYKKLILNDPIDYYSIVAIDRLVKQNESIPNYVTGAVARPAAHQNISLQNYSSEFKRSIKRLISWISIGNDRLAFLETNYIIKTKSKNTFKKSTSAYNQGATKTKKHITAQLTTLLTSKSEYLHTFKLIYKYLGQDLFSINRKILTELFPIDYYPQILKNDSNIDPMIVLALIRQESAFNPKARSHAGARGLMQLMPATARRFKKRVKAYQLKNPALNLKLGIKLLNNLMKRYDGNLTYTLAAYNAGERNLEKWVDNLFITSDPLITIESIPFTETRKYVKLIYRNIFFYKFLFQKELNIKTNVMDYISLGQSATKHQDKKP